jgi:hypothetical protein
MYIWSTSGDERVRGTPKSEGGKYPDAIPSHYLMNEKLCRWDDSTVYSDDGGKTWRDRPAGAVQLHPGEDYQCRCTALAYWNEIVDEVDEQIDLLSESADNIPNAGSGGLLVMDTPSLSSNNQIVQQNQRTAAAERLARNQAASEAIIKQEYPNEKFLSTTAQLQAVNKWTKNLKLPKNVHLAESRIPRIKRQSEVLEKELRQAGILSRLGNSVYLTPEPGRYKQRVTDAVVNGVHFEFRNITGTRRQVEQDFSDAKVKATSANVFLNIDSDIGKNEVRRRIGMVLGRHEDYTGKIIVSLKGEKPYFWDTSSFR